MTSRKRHDKDLAPVKYRPMGATNRMRRGFLLRDNGDGTANVIDKSKGGVRLTKEWEMMPA